MVSLACRMRTGQLRGECWITCWLFGTEPAAALRSSIVSTSQLHRAELDQGRSNCFHKLRVHVMHTYTGFSAEQLSVLVWSGVTVNLELLVQQHLPGHLRHPQS